MMAMSTPCRCHAMSAMWMSSSRSTSSSHGHIMKPWWEAEVQASAAIFSIRVSPNGWWNHIKQPLLKPPLTTTLWWWGGGTITPTATGTGGGVGGTSLIIATGGGGGGTNRPPTTGTSSSSSSFSSSSCSSSCRVQKLGSAGAIREMLSNQNISFMNLSAK